MQGSSSGTGTGTDGFAGYENEYAALRKTLEELNASLDEHQPIPYAEHTSTSNPRQHEPSMLQNLPQAQDPQAAVHAKNKHLNSSWYKQDAVLQDRTNAMLQQQPSQTHLDRLWNKEDAAVGDRTRHTLHQEPSHAHSDRRHHNRAHDNLQHELSHEPSESRPGNRTASELQQKPGHAQPDRRQGSRRHSAPEPSVLGSGSLRSLPVLNNSFIVPAQAAKPQKVDRVARHK